MIKMLSQKNAVFQFFLRSVLFIGTVISVAAQIDTASVTGQVTVSARRGGRGSARRRRQSGDEHQCGNDDQRRRLLYFHKPVPEFISP